MTTENLSLYNIFLAVADAGSILSASKKLFISQPAVSKSIKKLEENLHTVLFNRTSKGVFLTDDGMQLYNNISNAFDYIRTGEEQLRLRNSLGIGHIRIGVSSTLCKYILLPFLSGFTGENPHISISIECRSSGDTAELLTSGKIQLGLIARPENHSGLVLNEIGYIHDTFAATPQYLCNLKERSSRTSTLHDFANIMVLNSENVTRKYVDRHIPEDFYNSRNILEADSMDLLIEFAKTGIGIGCVIREFIKKELTAGELVEYNEFLSDSPKRQVCFAYCADKPLSGYEKIFWDYVSDNLRDPRINILAD